MKIVKVNLNEERNEIVDDIKILPLSDVHLGDPLCNLKALKKVLQEIKDEPNTYTILNGDMCNVALKNSKSDVYSDDMSPMEQMIELSSLLETIKNKILLISSGNHDMRIAKETNIDIIRVVARELGIEERYAEGMWYLFLQFGKCRRGRPIQYEITGYHGNVGGRKSGGKINRLEEMSAISIADLYIMSHSHKPIITKGITYMPDEQHQTMVKKELYYLMTNSFVEYGGYAETMGLPPSNTGMTEALLNSKVKKIKLSM